MDKHNIRNIFLFNRFSLLSILLRPHMNEFLLYKLVSCIHVYVCMFINLCITDKFALSDLKS